MCVRVCVCACVHVWILLYIEAIVLWEPTNQQLTMIYHVVFDWLQITEKKIASRLKWDLNAVTVADFIHELSERLLPLLDSYLTGKLVEHSMTLANVCLICEYCIFSIQDSILDSIQDSILDSIQDSIQYPG